MIFDKTSRDALLAQEADLSAEYQSVLEKKLKLDLTRGKPSAEQVSLANALDGILAGDYSTEDGGDVRNYGGLEGIREARVLGAQLLDMPWEKVLAGGNSSLTLMYQAMAIAYHHGLNGPESAWKHLNDEGLRPAFICPVPGYDRHFSVCEQLDIDMLTVPMLADGPDMDRIETLVADNPSIRGMWCVPKYSNPTGVVYSEDTVKRIALLGLQAHRDFRVFWDNAYAVHDLSEPAAKLHNLYEAAIVAGTEDYVLQFASTSKITFAGGGVAFMGASERNTTGFKRALGVSTIGPDKVNQLRHARFFQSPNSLTDHMRRHAEVIKPRFACVLQHLEAAFGENKLGHWERPDGGYFISFDTAPGLAREVVQLAKDAGVNLTPAGATFPYGHDPLDRNIRIAPTVPSVDDLNTAMAVFTLCVQLASVRKTLLESE